ncbi:MAG: bacteriohopanetetrol glucosamine biosynthesis glycosyltransferase HpnI [Bryobacteraceae bacterium]|nr:bacteriohopanetetrol glucosamine biosynthesis glycosyltransferase HpnI [Bryobacteraceae bacterium]
MFWILLLIAIAAAGYQLVALLASLTKAAADQKAKPHGFTPDVSVLKPVRGVDPDLEQAFRSQLGQAYPGRYEVLFGVRDPRDPATEVIDRLCAEYPDRARKIVARTEAPNAKVGVLADLAAAARHDFWVIADADIRVPEDYLLRVLSPLKDESVGLVTCLYRAHAVSWAGHWEALGIATDFAPSTLVAPFFGVEEFAFGSTMAVRAADVRKMGGLEVLGDYIADDYQLGSRIYRMGKRCVLSETVVDTSLNDTTWAGIWRHQLRWARTIRVSRPGGYLGLPVTNASLWALVCAVSGYWWLAILLLAVRMAMAFTVSVAVLRSADAVKMLLFVPLRDLWGFGIWLAGLAGDTVIWRGNRLRLSRDGRIRPA